MAKMTREDLDKLAAQQGGAAGDYIKVGLSSCGIAAGARTVYDLFAQEVKKRTMPVTVGRSGCSGACFAEPLVEVSAKGLPTVIYGRVTPEVAIRILEEHVRDGRLVNDYIVDMMVRR